METNSDIVVSLDVGSQNIRMMMAQSPTEERHFPRIIATAKTVSRGGIRHGYVTNITDTTQDILQTIRALEKNSGGIPVTHVSVTMNSVSTQSVQIESSITITNKKSTITEHDITRCTAECEQIFHESLRNKKILHIFPLSWTLDDQKIMGNPLGMQGTELVVICTVVFCQEQHYANLISAITHAGITVVDVVASPIAESLCTVPKVSRVAGCALVNVGSETISVSVFENNILISLAIFPYGSMNITHDIALGFQVPIDEAVQIKHGTYEGILPKKKLADIIEARTVEIFQLINNHLKTINRNELLPGGIIVTGGGSLLANIDEYVHQAIHLPVSLPRPEEIFKNAKRDLDQSWFSVYGLCHMINTSSVIKPPHSVSKIAHDAKDSFMKLFQQFIP